MAGGRATHDTFDRAVLAALIHAFLTGEGDDGVAIDRGKAFAYSRKVEARRSRPFRLARAGKVFGNGSIELRFDGAQQVGEIGFPRLWLTRGRHIGATNKILFNP